MSIGIVAESLDWNKGLKINLILSYPLNESCSQMGGLAMSLVITTTAV